jgi:dCMP deaminase
MNRISRHTAFMQTAEVWSRRSTCYRRSVGCVITNQRDILAIGYNGPAAGEAHCTGPGCTTSVGCVRAIHAERNAIERLPAAGVREVYQDALDMYVTESPCPDCARLVLSKNIGRVFYLNEYRLVEGIEILIGGGVKVYRMTPSGYVVDRDTNELVEI